MLHRIFFHEVVCWTHKIQKTANFSRFSVFFGHMQDMHDLKCKDIIIIDEYELQLPLISLFHRKNVDQSN